MKYKCFNVLTLCLMSSFVMNIANANEITTSKKTASELKFEAEKKLSESLLALGKAKNEKESNKASQDIRKQLSIVLSSGQSSLTSSPP